MYNHISNDKDPDSHITPVYSNEHTEALNPFYSIKDIALLEERLDSYICSLPTDTASYNYGLPQSGFIPGYGIINVQDLHYISHILLLCNTPESKYYEDMNLIKYAEDFFSAVIRLQSTEGFISLPDCNIYSPPDTAFAVNRYTVFLKYLQNTPKWNGVIDKIKIFIKRAAEGLLSGGFHTPNHRWVITCALCFAYELLGDERYKNRAEAFLAEGLDINAYGEWTEKSNAVYNAVCDLYLFHIGELTGYNYIFDAIRKNLDMMKYLLHPNDIIATEYSTRQDKGKPHKMGASYSIIYYLMARKDNNSEYAYLSYMAAENCKEDLPFLMIYNKAYDFCDLPKKPIPLKYTRLLNEGEKEKCSFGNVILRHRNNNFSLTAMENERSMLYIQYGDVRVFSISLVVGWFGIAQICFPSLRKINDHTFVLETTLDGAYYGLLPPCETEGKNGNWEAMDNSKRPRLNELSLRITAVITLHDKYVELTVEAQDIPHIMLQLVCKVDPCCEVFGKRLIKADEHNLLLTDGSAICQTENASLEITGGEFGHTAINLRNHTTDSNAKNILINFVTPTRKSIRFIPTQNELEKQIHLVREPFLI